MSWELVLSVRRWPVSSTARHVGMVIGTHANRMGRAWPSLDTLAAETGLSRRTVSRAVAELRDADLVTIQSRMGQSSEYVFAPVLRAVHSHPSESYPQPGPSTTEPGPLVAHRRTRRTMKNAPAPLRHTAEPAENVSARVAELRAMLRR